jgi:hypothetical protein
MVNHSDDAKHFIYLGTTVSETGGTIEDIRRRLGHARLAYNELKSVWNNSQFERKTKMKLLKSMVPPVSLTVVPRYMKCLASSTAVPSISMGWLLFVFILIALVFAAFIFRPVDFA